jgi:hypothetical protein
MENPFRHRMSRGSCLTDGATDFNSANERLCRFLWSLASGYSVRFSAVRQALSANASGMCGGTAIV